MEQEVRYCTSVDGTRIAYCIQGEGPVLVICPGFWEQATLTWEMPEWRAFLERMGAHRRLIQYDRRGFGLSQRSVTSFTLADEVNDLAAVFEAAELQNAAIFCDSTSGPLAVTFSAEFPAKVSQLIIWGSFVRASDVIPPETLASLIQLCRTNWTIALPSLILMGSREVAEGISERIRRHFEESATGENVALHLEQMYKEADISQLLRDVKTPTLVLHRRNDPIFPFKGAQELAAGISGARLVPLEGDAHPYFLGDSVPVLRALDSFLGSSGDTRQSRSDSAFRTVLFTDLVGHTEMMARLGDERGRDVLREHERITREVLKANGGSEVKTMGDGFMASFGSVKKAVECAVALQRAFDERNQQTDKPTNLAVRCGLNAGEPIEEDGDLFGATVILASRIAAKASGGEILVANAVRELCAGKGFAFSDRGEFVAKGFEEPVRVYEVNWRE